ncbi:hypothetical protein QFC19_006453 [Naganishia cerealis]|uniref:Uncharacterized protein n=1 Tax=Naganishia cerealis TaxID=610337 RepID=A0ACC2VGN5_9TREE|nr:hypothetical protein QFC19_006453 [Naganishia cerealis]
MSDIEDREEANRLAYVHNYPPHHDTILKDTYDVVVVGAGPAGLMLCTALARFGGHSVLCIDFRDEPTTAGRADGIQPRTIEVLKNMEPLGTELFNMSAASYERTFWVPGTGANGEETIVRDRRVQSFPETMEIEDGCTLGLQQGMIEEAFLRDMDRNGLRVTRPYSFKSYTIDGASSTDPKAHPVTVELVKGILKADGTHEGEVKSVKTKYLIGCDGGRSAVRMHGEKHHGLTMAGDLLSTLWGAGDFVVKTDFPDIRKIAAIHSANQGSAYVFPRENNVDNEPMIRLYTQVNVINGEKSTMHPQEARWKVTAQDIMDADKRIFHPYKLEFVKTEWWSAYPIGQRLISRYDVENRVFMAGDACHTHSPKAGQGMNTALIDSHNLSFKLNLVLRGLAHPDLLKTYNDERWKIGKQLIDFDEEYAALFSGEVPKSTPEVANMTKEEVKEHFIQVQRRNAGFTTGAGVNYHSSALVVMNEDLGQFDLKPINGLKLVAGQRLQPATQPVRLLHEVQFDAPGSFRIYVLPGGVKESHVRLAALAKHLASADSFVNKYKAQLPKNRKILHAAQNTGLTGHEEINPFFTFLTIIKDSRYNFEIENYTPYRGVNVMLYADDQEASGKKTGEHFSESRVGGTYAKYGLSDGGIIVCRPDGYVGIVVPFEQAGFQALDKYFQGALHHSSSPVNSKL